MARSNSQGDSKRVITPISNCRWYQSTLYAKPNVENLNTNVFFFPEPDRDSFSEQEDYDKAKGVFDKNMKEYNVVLAAMASAKENKTDYDLVAEEVFNKDGNHIGYRYDVDLSETRNNGNIVQAVSGRIINLHELLDTLKSGDTKQKWIVDLFDFAANERYTVTMSIAVIGRNVIDSICSLTPAQLEHDIQIAFIRYEYKGDWRIKTEVSVLNPDAEYGREVVEGTFEISKWNEKEGRKVAKPVGSKADNAEFMTALTAKISKERDADLKFITFYKRITSIFKETVLTPSISTMFELMGWGYEIKEISRTKTVKKGRSTVKIEEKTNESIILTSKSTSVEAPVDDEKNSADEVPF